MRAALEESSFTLRNSTLLMHFLWTESQWIVARRPLYHLQYPSHIYSHTKKKKKTWKPYWTENLEDTEGGLGADVHFVVDRPVFDPDPDGGRWDTGLIRIRSLLNQHSSGSHLPLTGGGAPVGCRRRRRRWWCCFSLHSHHLHLVANGSSRVWIRNGF